MVRTIQCTPHAGLPKVWLGFGEIGHRQSQLQAKQDSYFNQIAPDIRFVHRDDQVSFWDLHRDVLFRQAQWFPWKYKDQTVREFVLPSIVQLDQVPKLMQFLYTGDYSIEREDLRRYKMSENPQACINCPQLATLLYIHSDMVRTASFLGIKDLQTLAFVRFRALLDAAPVSVLRHAIRQVYSHGRMCPATHHSNGFPMLSMASCDYRPQMVLPAVLRWCGYYRLHPEWIFVNGRLKHFGEQQFTQLRQNLPEFDAHLTRGLFLDTIDATVPIMLLYGESRPIRTVDPTNRPEIMSMKSNTCRSNYQYATFLQPLPFESPKNMQEQELVDSDTEMSNSPEDDQEPLLEEEECQQSLSANRRITRLMARMTNKKSAIAANTKLRVAKKQQKTTKSVVRPPKNFTPAQATRFLAQTHFNNFRSAKTLDRSQSNFPAATTDNSHSHIPTLEEVNADNHLQNIGTNIDLDNVRWTEYLNAPLTVAHLALANKGLQTAVARIPSLPANDFGSGLQNLASHRDNHILKNLFNGPSEPRLTGVDALLNASPTSLNTSLNDLANLDIQVSNKPIGNLPDVDLHDWFSSEVLSKSEANISGGIIFPGIDHTGVGLSLPAITQEISPEWTTSEEVTIFRMHAPEREKILWPDEINLDFRNGTQAPAQDSGFDDFEKTFWNDTVGHGLTWVPAGMSHHDYCIDLLCQILEMLEDDGLTTRPEAMVNYMMQIFPDVDMSVMVQNLIDALPEEYKFPNIALRDNTYTEQNAQSSGSEQSETLTDQIEALTDADRAEYGSDASSFENSE